MQRKYWLFILVPFILIGSYLAYSYYQSQTVVMNYIDQVTAWNQEQASVLSEFTEGFVQEEDEKKALEFIKTEIIPNYKQLAIKVGSANYKQDDIKLVHHSYVKAVDAQLDVFKDFAKAIEQNDEKLYRKTDDQLEKVRKYWDEHQQELIKLAENRQIHLSIS